MGRRFLLLAALFSCHLAVICQAQQLDFRGEYKRLRSIEGVSSSGFSFARLGFRGDLSTAELAEYESEYTPPPGGERSAYWHKEYGGWVKGAYAVNGGCFAISHTKQLRLWSLVDGQEFLRIPHSNNAFVYGVAKTKEGAHILCAPRRYNVRPIDAAGQLMVYDFKTGEKLGFRLILTELGVDRERCLGPLAATGLTNEAGLPKPGFAMGSGLSELVTCNASPDARFYATAHKDGKIVLWNATNGSRLRTWQLPDRKRTGSKFNQAYYLNFSPDGSKLVASSGYNTYDLVRCIVLNTESGELIRGFPIYQAVYAPGTDFVIGRDGYEDVQIWSIKTGKPVAAPFYCSSERYHAMKTRNGYFTASPEMLAFLRKYSDRLKPGREDNFVDKYYRPDIVRRVLAGMPAELAEQLPPDYAPPTTKLRLVSVSKQKATIALKASASGAASLEKITIHRKERPFSDATADQWQRPSADEMVLTLPFPPGNNAMQIAARVSDNYGIESSEVSLSLQRPERIEELSGRLFVLTIGVADHKFPEYNLRYPAVDASALAKLLKRQEGLVFGEVHAQVYTDDRATLANIRDGLHWIERVATSDDVAVVYIAGHGLRGRRGLYYVPYAGDAQAVQYTCLNWEEIAKSMENVKAKQLVFLSDVCHGGGFADSELASQGELVKRVAAVEGTLVYAASGADELAYEDEKWQHGAFTNSLLVALRGDADANDDKKINLEEMIRFTTKATQNLTAQAQNPYVASTAGYLKSLVIAKETDREVVDPSKSLESPVAANESETDSSVPTAEERP